MMTRFYKPFLLILLSVCPLLAQDTDNGEAKTLRGRQAWIIAVAVPEDLENPAKIMSGKDITEVTFSTRSVGDPVKITEDGFVRMVREKPNPEDDKKPLIEVLAEAHVADTVSKALIILVPTKKKDGSSLLFSSKVQDLAAFRGGETLYLNLSPMDVLVQLGEEKIPLRKGAVQVTKAPRSSEAVNKAVSYSYFDPAKDKWKLLGASTIVVQPTRREICIFSWDPNFDRIDYHGITFPMIE